MARLFFGVDGPGDADLSVDMQISDSDMPRILAYLMASAHGTVTENVQREVPDPSWSPDEKKGETEADRPMVLVQEWVTRRATMEETAEAYARATLSLLLAETVNWEKAQAAAAAAAAVQPIEPIG